MNPIATTPIGKTPKGKTPIGKTPSSSRWLFACEGLVHLEFTLALAYYLRSVGGLIFSSLRVHDRVGGGGDGWD